MRAALLLGALALVCAASFASADCTSYCAIMTVVDGTSKCQYSDYPSTAACMAACAQFPSTGTTGDMTGNTLQCREYWAGQANSDVDTANSCTKAAAHGGNVCGNTCNAYCNFMVGPAATSYCHTNAMTFASVAECETTFCAKYQTNGGFSNSMAASVQHFNGNSQECRFYHAQAGVMLSAAAHCIHAQPLSNGGTCVNLTRFTDGNAQTTNYCENHLKGCGVTDAAGVAEGFMLDTTYGQWASFAQCKAYAGKYFTRGAANAQEGDTLDSRNYHGLVGGFTIPANKFHCQHSGVNGKQFCTGTTTGTTVDYTSGCRSFCEAHLKVCNTSSSMGYTTAAGAADITTCINLCLSNPRSASETPYVTTGDSLQCRLYHVQVAGSVPTTALHDAHCYHAGPTGGDAATLCGTAVEAFCDATLTACNMTGSSMNAYAQFSSKAQCIAVAASFPRDSSLTSNTQLTATAGNSLECRLYHATVSLSSPTAAAGPVPHCYHTGALGGAGVCGSACEGYCNMVQAGCTGSNVVFASTAQCLAWCASYPTSVTYMPDTFTSGNTIGCRAYHASVALAGDATAKTTHCPHARPVSGGDTCGTACQAYCNTIMSACNNTNSQFASLAACTSACSMYSVAGATGDATGNTLQCRQYHAGVALLGDAAAKTLHCPHAGATPTDYCVAAGSSTGSASTGSNGATGVSASLALVAAAIVAAVAAKQL